MKNKLKKLLIIAPAILLVGCGKTTTDDPTTKDPNPTECPETPECPEPVECPEPEVIVDVAKNVIEKISGDLYLAGTSKSYYNFGVTYEEMSSLDVKTAYTQEFTYYEESDGTSFGHAKFLNDGGTLATSDLDYKTNEVIVEPYMVGGTYAKYTDVFKNPFPYSDDLFEVKTEGTIGLKEGAAAYFNVSAFANITTLGTQLSLTELTIKYDADYNATEVSATYDDDYGFERSVYSGKFVSSDTIKVVADPVAVEKQDGQETLTNKIKEIKNMNYTCTFEVFQDGMLTPDYTWTHYSTPSAYYTVFPEELRTQAPDFYGSRGVFDTDKGAQPFKVGPDGTSVAYSCLPYAGYSAKGNMSQYWNYTGDVFNVNKDGSYSLPVISGLYENLSSGFYLDEGVFYFGMTPDAGSFKITIEDNGDLIYTYTFNLPHELDDGTYIELPYYAKGTVSNIGSTTIPVDYKNGAPYTPVTNAADWFEKQSMEDYGEAFAEITHGHADEVPFIETSMSYEANKVGRGVYTGDDEEESDPTKWVFWEHSINWVMQCGNAGKQYEVMSYYIDALEANTSYRYDQYADAYIYSDGEKDLFSVHVEGMDDYVTLFASLDYAVKVEVVNLVLPEGVDEWPGI